jgi:hypothetical protein
MELMMQTSWSTHRQLIQATGGAVKPAKSFWYLLSWKFRGGQPVLKTMPEYNTLSLFVPQPDAPPARIRLLDNDHTEKTLGVWSNPLNNPAVPLTKLKDKGLNWVDKLCRRPLECRDVWLSLTTQEYPKWSYGLSSLYATPSQLDALIGSVCFRALPQLGFNRNITTEFRTLPSEYQGIGLQHWSIEKLAKDLSFLLRHWNSNSTLGRSFQLLYEAFQMELGLNGNILNRSFPELKYLATHSWFKILWQYASTHINLHQRFNIQIQPTRVNDISINEFFLRNGIATTTMTNLNRICKHYHVHSLADILHADGAIQ